LSGNKPKAYFSETLGDLKHIELANIMRTENDSAAVLDERLREHKLAYVRVNYSEMSLHRMFGACDYSEEVATFVGVLNHNKPKKGELDLALFDKDRFIVLSDSGNRWLDGNEEPSISLHSLSKIKILGLKDLSDMNFFQTREDHDLKNPGLLSMKIFVGPEQQVLQSKVDSFLEGKNSLRKAEVLNKLDLPITGELLKELKSDAKADVMRLFAMSIRRDTENNLDSQKKKADDMGKILERVDKYRSIDRNLLDERIIITYATPMDVRKFLNGATEYVNGIKESESRSKVLTK
jgi:hypothetical protein